MNKEDFITPEDRVKAIEKFCNYYKVAPRGAIYSIHNFPGVEVLTLEHVDKQRNEVVRIIPVSPDTGIQIDGIETVVNNSQVFEIFNERPILAGQLWKKLRECDPEVFQDVMKRRQQYLNLTGDEKLPSSPEFRTWKIQRLHESLPISEAVMARCWEDEDPEELDPDYA